MKYQELAEKLREIAVEQYEYYLEKYGKDSLSARPVPDDFVEKVLADLESVEIVKGIYDVYNIGIDGRDHDTITFVKADSTEHARLLVAIERGSTEIFQTGFYDATLVERKVIEMRLYDLKKEQEMLEKVL